MKKIIALLMVLMMLVACQSSPATTKPEEGNKETTNVSKDDKTIAKVGFGYSANVADSKAKEADKNATADFAGGLAAIAVNKDGVIVKAIFDEFHFTVNLDEKNQLPADFDKQEFLTKMELKEKYDLLSASKIKKHYFEQIAHFESFAVGKTVDEVVKAIDAKDADLVAGATVHLDAIKAALVKANSNLIDASGATKIGLGVNTTASKSAGATAEKGAKVAFDTVLNLVASDDSGKVVKDHIDTLQGVIEFDLKGALAVKDTNITSKQDLKEKYGMKKSSAIGKEWFEQAAELAKYLEGKTAADVSGWKLNDKKQLEDIVSTVSIKVSGYQPAIVESLNNLR